MESASASGLAFMEDGAEELGQSSLGVVRLASYCDAAVAVKHVEGSSSLSDQELQLDHPYVNRMLARLADTDGKLLEVRELCANGDLFDLVVEQGGLHPEDALEMLRQAALGLAHCHGCRIAHGQLRAEQLMLGANDQLQLLGMCAGRERRPLKPRSPLDAPELATMQAATFEERKAADAWACGVLYLIMLIGQPPADLESFVRVSTHGLEEVPGCAELVPGPLHELMRQLLDVQPVARPTLAQVVQLVEAHLNGDSAAAEAQATTEAAASAQAAIEVAPAVQARTKAASALPTTAATTAAAVIFAEPGKELEDASAPEHIKSTDRGKKRPKETESGLRMVRTCSEGSGEL